MKYLIHIFFFLYALPAFCQSGKIEAEHHVSANGIQVIPVTDEGTAGKAVGYWNRGDYIVLPLDIPKAGMYRFAFRTGTNINGATYELRDENEKVLATLQLPNTGSHGTFTTVTAFIPLKRGRQQLKYISVADNAGADINWISFDFSHEAGAPLVELPEDTTIIVSPSGKANARIQALARDAEGRITTYAWKKISGAGTISSTSQPVLSITGLPVGEHVFEVKVTDNEKNSTTRKIKVVVATCKGKKILLSPSGGDGTGISLQTPDYDKRKIFYPDPGYNPGWNFPRIKVRPGDTIALRSQYHWSFIDLFGIEGTEGCPVVITSDTGVVHIDRGIRLVDARYVKITGRGKHDSLSTYPTGNENFRINIKGVDQIKGRKGFGHGGIAIEIIGRSAHVEVDMIRAERKGYGVQAKQDPLCEPQYNYPNWIMDDIHIHHSYFENILQDVLYLGNTDPLGTRQINCPTGLAHHKPMRLSNFNIHHNRILKANRTGIQLGGAETGFNQIHHNYVSDCGYEFNQHQGAGISIGGMSRNVHVYDNIVKKTFLYGIFDLGTDSSFVYNNFVDSSGYLDIRLCHPTMNVDSLAAALGVAKASGNCILNLYQNGITNIQSTTKESFPKYTKTVFYMNNVLGINTSKLDQKGIISFSEWGPAADWSENSVVCGNTRLDGQPVSVETFRFKSKKWPVFSENCNDSPFNKKDRPAKKPATQTRGISKALITGTAISIVVLAGIYVAVKKIRR